MFSKYPSMFIIDILDYVRWHICNIISYHHIMNIVGVCIYILCIRTCCDSGNVSLLTPLLPDSGFDPSLYGGFRRSWGYQKNHPVVMDDHDLVMDERDLVLKPMVTWGSPIFRTQESQIEKWPQLGAIAPGFGQKIQLQKCQQTSVGKAASSVWLLSAAWLLGIPHGLWSSPILDSII